ncbi:MAG: hypothetical protein GY906_24820 [bacterium]|nr:hypothetical protein [bacterium]
MTYERWMQIDRLQWEKLRKANPTANMRRMRKNLTVAMVRTHGPRPSKPKEAKPPWWGRLLLRVVRPKVERALEEKMDGKASKVPKWALALVAGVAACGGILQAAMGSDGIDAQEWVAIANAFVVAAWAKFSNPEKVVSPKPSVK